MCFVMCFLRKYVFYVVLSVKTVLFIMCVFLKQNQMCFMVCRLKAATIDVLYAGVLLKHIDVFYAVFSFKQRCVPCC